MPGASGRPYCQTITPPSRLCCIYASITLLQLSHTMSDTSSQTKSSPASVPAEQAPVPAVPATERTPMERPAPDPTRYGDWEKNGRCIDF
ncbi:MAG TPA: DUF1674 domain-containing protein [Dyella sp.]|uniref:DUF1674 domain-containing protein n=1 Tax=Dyella sp. TaxID=1869338 RepID=UPI002D76D89A|nr:succinate dehydrogenase assembly factor 4 [Dyella sp.]HET6552380.1 DUF1674 domain-containing protein [Dyella sp.]